MKFIKLIKADKKEDFLISKLKKEIKEGDPLDLLLEGVITKQNSELFTEAINEVLKPDNYSMYDMSKLLDAKIITKADKILFEKLIQAMMDDSYGNACDILLEKIVDKQDGDLFKKVLEVAIDERCEDELLNEKILTKDELKSFKNNNL